MSFQAMAWAVEQDLPASQKLVLLMLANYTNHHTGRCDPSHDRLARDCGMTDRCVRDQIKKLEERGLLRIEKRDYKGLALSNQYHLSLSSINEDQQHGRNDVPTGRNDVPDGAEAGSYLGRKQVPTNLEVKPISNQDTVDRFAAFWSSYPKKIGKPKAMAAFKKVKPEEIDALMAALEVHKKQEQWTKDNGQFIPFPTTWLNQRRWEDEIDGPEPTPERASKFKGAI